MWLPAAPFADRLERISFIPERMERSSRERARRTQTPLGPTRYTRNMGNANYNSLQASLKRTAGRLTMLASYTYGKSMDWASSIQEQVNPFNFRQEYAPSAFDMKHNFVFSYNYELPIEKLFRSSNRFTQSWAISGITRFASGLPVTFQSFGDNALVQVQNNGVNSVSIDLLDYNRILGRSISATIRGIILWPSTPCCSPRTRKVPSAPQTAESSMDRESTTTIWRCAKPLASRSLPRSNSVSRLSTPSTTPSSMGLTPSTGTSTTPPLAEFSNHSRDASRNSL